MALEHESDSALAIAVRAAGSQSAFGRIVQKPQSTVACWLKTEKQLPAELVLTVEKATHVSKYVLRPDIYPLEPAKSAATRKDALPLEAAR